MKNKNKCAFCGDENSELINNIYMCSKCEQNLLNALLKRNTPKPVKSIFLKDNSHA